ncbi:hypothetical protein TIFTF001_030662 [Ficus carica]|uniref:F-box domain-containing protein n=1 Tax=Ficus carica TaxID=3494 RepID=A0AA88J5A6_FICCA|nr:hypothetical protein TIFTF001_030662 [Ficus carica]
MSKEVADGENPLAPLVTSLQLRIQELEAENAKLLSQLSNCTISEDKKWRGLLCNLPEELLVEILSQLPPESLMQLKCTSKSCTRSCCYKNCDAPKCSEVMFSLLNVSINDDADDQIHFVSKDLSSLLDVTGSDARTITLCNPAIREFKLLPKPSHVFRSRGVGFGYDSRANDYKIVTFGFDNLEHFRAEVYSLTTHSWREIVFGLDIVDCFTFYTRSVHLKGIFYWLSSERNILCFDMCNEVFHSILMPGDCEFEAHNTRLTVWNESVAVIYSHRSGKNAMSFEIWVMDNCYDSNKGSCSWCKVFTIGPLVEMFEALAFRNDDELLIRNFSLALCSYNIRSQKLREIDIFKVNDDVQFWSFSYVKSLVSVRGTK